MTRPTPAEVAWQTRAACAEVGGGLWFPDDGLHVERGAIRLCATCPVRDECLAFALEHQIHDGIWGGLSYRQRRRKARADADAMPRAG